MEPSSGMSSDVAEETTSFGEVRRSSSEEEDSDYQGQCLAAPQAPPPTYKQRSEEFKKVFKEPAEKERLIVDYTCALQWDILLMGRLYLTEHHLCFHSNVFRGTKITLLLKDFTSMTRVNTARFIPNAIQVCTAAEKLVFTSFSAREKSFQSIFRMWQNTLLKQHLTCAELWQMVKQHYGNELGMSLEDMENVPFRSDSNLTNSLTMRPSVEEGIEHLERIPSVRMDQGPLATSTPQGEEPPAPLGTPPTNPGNTDDSRSAVTQQRGPAPLPDQVSKRSTLTLDLNANVGGASEQSASESVDEAEEQEYPAQEQGRVYLNKVFHISAEKMFELLFTDSSFIQRFMSIRKITNASLDPWQREDSGNMKRTMNYTIAISNPLIGKCSRATENQTLFKDVPEGHYMVDAEVFTHDVPYHDYFYTQNRYAITRSSRRKCRLRVLTDVKYKKQPWGLVKSFINKNSWSGIEDYFKQLESELLEEEAEMNQGARDAGKMSNLRRRRRTFSRSGPEHLKPSGPYGADSEQHREGPMGSMDLKAPYRWNIHTIIAGMSVILLVLTLLNLGLLAKLWAMEDVAQRMYLSTKHRIREQAAHLPRGDYGPIGPGLGPRSNKESQLLKAVLQDSINLLEQLRGSLVMLQHNFAMANRTAGPQ
ncbi:protein Aster-C [Gadus morhua]|uniref:GRAM domain containing 1C n=1 Tax=Gadus morhua TaxID=8049 RepID=A0A8C5F8S7_GADMO|nr:protein Aster-C [Gadus morhua]